MDEKLNQLVERLEHLDTQLQKTRLKRRRELVNDFDASVKPHVFQRWRDDLRACLELSKELQLTLPSW